MGSRTFDIIAVNRHSTRESVWRVHSCENKADASRAADGYNARMDGEHILADPISADGDRPAALELDASGRVIARRNTVEIPRVVAATDAVNSQSDASVRLDDDSIRRLQWAVFKAVMLAWFVISVISGLLLGLIIAMT
jgi:hypothetical protein